MPYIIRCIAYPTQAVFSLYNTTCYRGKMAHREPQSPKANNCLFFDQLRWLVFCRAKLLGFVRRFYFRIRIPFASCISVDSIVSIFLNASHMIALANVLRLALRHYGSVLISRHQVSPFRTGSSDTVSALTSAKCVPRCIGIPSYASSDRDYGIVHRHRSMIAIPSTSPNRDLDKRGSSYPVQRTSRIS